jgi:hypothetical protein
MSRRNPDYVRITDDSTGQTKTYAVKRMVHSISRGFEYELVGGDNLVHRVCHAPPAGIKSYTTGRETVRFVHRKSS